MALDKYLLERAANEVARLKRRTDGDLVTEVEIDRDPAALQSRLGDPGMQ
ncbi:MAG: hypothetical protein J0H84_11725 [Rhizobiales bacterium]|nr:hypothetical protein [Hyphomicrobiales bacterium]